MTVSQLAFDHDSSTIARLAAEADRDGPPELRRRWHWLLPFRLSRDVCQSIGVLWAGSPFVRQQQWAPCLASASVIVREDVDRYDSQPLPSLLLELDLPGGMRIEQAPPLQPSEAHAALSCGIPGQAAVLINDILTRSPGLTVGLPPVQSWGAESELCAPLFFEQPMAYVDFWINGYYAQSGGLNLAPERLSSLGECVCEVFHTLLGDAYLLRKDGSLVFFDHEEADLVPVEVDLRRLIEIYLEDSERILEPAGLGSV